MSVRVRKVANGCWLVDVMYRLPDGQRARERRRVLRLLGARRLDALNNETVAQLKRALGYRSAKTVNNVLTVLNKLLKTAVEWGALDRMPCTIRLLPFPKSSASFHDFGDYERLVAAANPDTNAYLAVLLGGEAGLRCGEMMALEWSDVDLAERQLRVERSEWKGHVTATEGGIRDDIHLFHEKLREWEQYYNYERPYGALNEQTPYERLVAKLKMGTSPAS